MFLKLDDINARMKLVYQLAEKMRENPEQVIKAQALTQDDSKPFGLKGIHGLYGSDAWWDNVKKGVLPMKQVSGVVEKLFVSGQERGLEANTFELLLGDGSKHTESILVNKKSDCQLFKVGSQVELLYVFDQLKIQPATDGSVNYLDILLEIAVSES
jgi:hypothetical protein